MKRYIFTLLIFVAIFCVSFVHAASISITPKDQTVYDDWIPTNGGTLDFLVTVTGASSSGEVQFSFDDVSNWEGVCMNYDDPGSGAKSTKQDLVIYGQQNTFYKKVDTTQSSPTLTPLGGNFQSSHVLWHTRLRGETACRLTWTSDANLPSDFTFPLTVTSEDYGSFGTLRVRLYKKRSWWFDIDESSTIKIPKDENYSGADNKIADAWEVSLNGWDATTKPHLDAEKDGNKWIGDGFVVFEEYRGFMVNGQHKRLHLKRKDVFVHSEFDVRFYPGLLTRDQVILGPATTPDGEPQNSFPSVFKVHFIKLTEMNSSRIVNYKRCIRVNGLVFWLVDMKGIHIIKNSRAYVPGNPLGEAYPSASYSESHSHGTFSHIHGGVPHDIPTVYSSGDTIVYSDQIDGEATRDLPSNATQAQIDALYTKQIGRTASHEFAHHLGLADHNVAHIVKETAASKNTPTPVPVVVGGNYDFSIRV